MKKFTLFLALIAVSFAEFYVDDIIINYINSKQDKWVAGRN